MAWGFNPYLMEKNQFAGAYLSVVESISKLVAAGFAHRDAYLSFQEYFERLRTEPERWGKPMAAVLGASWPRWTLALAPLAARTR